MELMAARHSGAETLLEAVGSTMAIRVQQRTSRVVIAVITASAFHPLTGVAVAAIWLFVFLLLQCVESVVFPAGRVRDRGQARLALGLFLLNKTVFALFAVPLAASGGLPGFIIGFALIAGAMIHAVAATGSSRIMAGAGTAPPGLVLLLLPMIMSRLDVGWPILFMVTCAAILLCCAALSAWQRVSRDMCALQTARLNADMASQAKSDFLTLISHEIRTPLNGIMGMAQSLSSDSLTVGQHDRLDTLIRSGQGLHELIGEVLDLARIEAGQLPLDSVTFNLRDLVRRSVEPFGATARSRGLELAVSLCPGLASAYLGDPVRLRQILHNLIAHAIQRSNEGEILVSASRDAEGVRLSVCDCGPDMMEAQLAGIFDRYPAEESAAATEDAGSSGLGLGLFMANQLVARMGGSISVTNRAPNGLCLTAAVPLSVAMSMAEFPRVCDAPNLASPALPGSLRVLVAEDHPVNRKVISLLLGQIDVVPTMVENGSLAVKACEEDDWDLVLMDIQMPVMDGVAAARRIDANARALGRTPPPIIAVTANVMAHELRRYEDAGMTLCVAKPVQAEALLQAMRTVLADPTPSVAPRELRR